MSSAATPPPVTRKFSSPLLRDVRVLYRRVCALRAAGKDDEADFLSSAKLATLVSRAREELALSDSALDELFTREEERVENAQALAEILLPLLTTAGVTAAVSGRNQAPLRAPETTFAGETAAAFAVPPGAPAAEGANAGPLLPGIADFIDEMLVQERAAVAPGSLRRPA